MPLVRTQTCIALGTLLVLTACGGGPSSAQDHGFKLVAETSAPFAYAPDFDARLQSTIDVALQYWGGTWDDMNGRTLTLVDDSYVSCKGTEALGCFDGNIRITTRDPGIGTFPCIEATVLVHEIGHVVLDDPDHTDPRWMEMDSVAAQLAGRPGYTDSGVATCTAYVSVWRHPLGSP